jgi:hypothetical protein
METAVKTARRTSEVTARPVERTRREDEHSDASASGHSVHEPDREGSPARSGTVRVRVSVEAELAATPATKGEIDDDESDRGLRRLLNPLGKNTVEEEDGKPEGNQRRRMDEAPG